MIIIPSAGREFQSVYTNTTSNIFKNTQFISSKLFSTSPTTTPFNIISSLPINTQYYKGLGVV